MDPRQRGLNWAKVDRMDQNRSKWTKLHWGGLNGLKWTELDRNASLMCLKRSVATIIHMFKVLNLDVIYIYIYICDLVL